MTAIAFSLPIPFRLLAVSTKLSPACADDDAGIVAAAQQGDDDAFARLVRQHQQRIARLLWRFTRDRRVLEELVQDTFVQAHASLGSYRGSGTFGAWLNQIATRVGYAYWRQQDRQRSHQAQLRQSAPPCGADADALDQLSAREAAERVHALLAGLPPRDRLVLTLLYLEELSVTEAAARAGWSVTMTKVQAFRARAKLRKLLEANDD